MSGEQREQQLRWERVLSELERQLDGRLLDPERACLAIIEVDEVDSEFLDSSLSNQTRRCLCRYSLASANAPWGTPLLCHTALPCHAICPF